MQPDPGQQALLALIPNLSIAAVFIVAWFQERKERQELNRQMLELQTAHRVEILKIIEKQFEVMSMLHLTAIANPPNPPLMDVQRNQN